MDALPADPAPADPAPAQRPALQVVTGEADPAGVPEAGERAALRLVVGRTADDGPSPGHEVADSPVAGVRPRSRVEREVAVAAGTAGGAEPEPVTAPVPTSTSTSTSAPPPASAPGSGRGRRRAAPAQLPPWPGRPPPPAPAVVLLEAVPVQVRDEAGEPVRVTARLAVSAAPARLLPAAGRPIAIVAWAGPWPVDERWWAPAEASRRAQFQVCLADGRALLLAVSGGRWTVEAVYD